MNAFVRVVCCLFVVSFASVASARAAEPLRLLRDPSISATRIAFAYGGDIWTVAREGGDARRLVTGYGLASGPLFSPDGTHVAFSANYDGNVDVYVVASGGGEPKRLTYHPDAEIAVGWTPDGTRVLFRSNQASPTDPNRLFTVALDGTMPVPVPLAMGETGAYSPDATRLAFVPNFRWEPFWQGYRGGQTTPVRIASLADSRTIDIPRNDSNDDAPMWLGDTVYFLSDRDGPVTLFAYDTRSRRVTRAIAPHGFDITSASANAGAIVYSQFGTLHVFDPRTHATHEIAVSIADDMAQLRPHYLKVGKTIDNAALSPTGVRAIFEAHGQIFTVPTDHGDARTIAGSSSVEARDPAWSPDGSTLAYFSDRSGEYALELRDQRALAAPRTISLGPPSFYYSPLWSPDGKRIAYEDKRLNLWYVDVAHGTPVRVATNPYADFGPSDFTPAWSPDGRYLAYAMGLANHLHAIDAYDTQTHAAHRITDGASDARNPQFDRGGKYLYFTSSTNAGPSTAGLDMTSDQHPVSSNVYVAVLRRSDPSPVGPQTGDEATKAGRDEPTPGPLADGTTEPAPSASGTSEPTRPKMGAKPVPAKTAATGTTPHVEIEYDGIDQRIVALPIPEANYVGANAGKAGTLFLQAAPLAQNDPDPPKLAVSSFDLTTRKVEPYVADASSFALSADGTKALVQRGPSWFVAPADKALGPDAMPLDLTNLEAYVEPTAEWTQMYDEVWRIERDFFYDPHFHGLDIALAEKRFRPYLAGIASRDDLTFLFREMLSYLSVGHMFVSGGSKPAMPKVDVGLLGADYRIEHGRYRFAKIYAGQNWDPALRAPLTAPGNAARAGEYLLAVDGRAVTSERSVYAFFAETAGKQTTLTVGPNPDASGSREITVVPVPSESPLRNLDWMETNRRTVDRLSGGKLAYVYMPDTEYGGYTNFNRYFFSQIGKAGLVLDERFNHGGQLADYVIDYLRRMPMSVLVPREGRTEIDPPLAIYGPKVLIANQFAGSGGDALPWYFRKAHIGPIVGVRTWGGLVGIGGYPPLKDGGSVTAPRIAIGGLRGEWEVEGHGIAPDIDVPQDERAVRAGHDPQLEAAVAKAMAMLRAHPLPTFTTPPYPNHHPVLPAVPGS